MNSRSRDPLELLLAGGLHYFRLPHPRLWRPVLQRLRMAGFTAVTLPTPWAYHSPAQGLYDFTGPRDLPRLLDEIEEAGLWLVLRGGPWLGLDLDAGGLPHWLLPHFNLASREFHRHLMEWWEHLFAHVQDRPNLLHVVVELPAGVEKDVEQEIVSLAQGLLSDISFVERVVFAVNETPNFEGSSRFVFLQAGLTPRWDAVSGNGELGEKHSATQLGVCLGQGVLSLSITPFVTGCSWDHWSAPGRSTKHGAGAPLTEGGALTAAYFHLRRRVLTAQTLSTVLDRSASTNRIYASDPTLLDAARTDGRTTVAFLRAAPVHEGATRLSLPLGDQLLNTTDIPVPADALRMIPLHWPLAGGWVHSLSMEPILYTVVAGRHLLVLLNETGGEIVLSRDFRPRHNRGAVHTERTDAELSVRFEPTRLASLLFAGPEGPFQLLALEPRLAERVWPLDDSVYETETFPPAWVPDPEEPARGLIIGPDLVVPTAEGGYRYSVSERGFGYRWGPWRGSDPHTWLAPISWSGPEPVTTPELIYRTSRPGMVEASPDYDDSGWRVIPSGASLAMEVHGIYRGFVWYRGHFSGESSGVTLTFRHACDLFLNGQHIASLNAPPYDLEGKPVPQRLPLPPRLLSENNVLTALVESQGHATDFDRVAQGHGLLTCFLEGGVPLHWRIRAGLSGERRVQGFTGFADWRLVPENGSPHVIWHRLTFDWELPDALDAALFLVVERTPAQAQIYLNNQLVGRCQAGGGNQVRFWLPDGILQGGANEILVAQWTRGASPDLGSLRLEIGPLLQHRTALV